MVNGHVDLRRQFRAATGDASGYLAAARVRRRREAIAELSEAVEANARPAAPADWWLQLSIVVSVAGCVLAAVGIVVGLVG
ncbi:hypothetical protein AFB00_09875 [Pseudonocardia sp. HH130630-07]|nr:hypothetical protein AFB00_09875 [Pseudonocardia sp. HH130630-07]